MANRKQLILGAVAVWMITGPAVAKHSWVYNGLQLHWARTSNPVTPPIEYDLDSFNWAPHLDPARVAWNSSIINGSVVTGDPDLVEFPALDAASNVADAVDAAICPGNLGKVRICNYSYGSNGWLGVAIVEYEETTGHILFGVVKLNDTYFNSTTYNKTEWRKSVLCQEIGHTLGLSHQDGRNFNPDLKDSYGRQTCMDYTARPLGNEKPNSHDYGQLGTIYKHLDTSTGTATQASGANAAEVRSIGNSASEWGKAVAFTVSGRGRIFEKSVGNGRRRVTFVRWTEAAAESPSSDK